MASLVLSKDDRLKIESVLSSLGKLDMVSTHHAALLYFYLFQMR